MCTRKNFPLYYIRMHERNSYTIDKIHGTLNIIIICAKCTNESRYACIYIYIYRFAVNWLKDPKYHELENVKSDSSLTDDEKRFLEGIHARNRKYVLAPSKSDIEYLEEVYSQSKYICMTLDLSSVIS